MEPSSRSGPVEAALGRPGLAIQPSCGDSMAEPRDLACWGCDVNDSIAAAAMAPGWQRATRSGARGGLWWPVGIGIVPRSAPLRPVQSAYGCRVPRSDAAQPRRRDAERRPSVCLVIQSRAPDCRTRSGLGRIGASASRGPAGGSLLGPCLGPTVLARSSSWGRQGPFADRAPAPSAAR